MKKINSYGDIKLVFDKYKKSLLHKPEMSY